MPELFGVVKGLGVTFRTMLKPAVTTQYPREKETPAPRARGVIALKEDNCTVCMLCARECPDWCLYIESHTETLPADEEQALRDGVETAWSKMASDERSWFERCVDRKTRLAADIGRRGSGEPVRDRRDRPQVGRHVLPALPVAATPSRRSTRLVTANERIASMWSHNFHCARARSAWRLRGGSRWTKRSKRRPTAACS